MKKKVAILGSTGSIGKQALEVIRQHNGSFQPVVLTARQNADLLIDQAVEFLPPFVHIASNDGYLKVKEALAGLPVEILSGADALKNIIELSAPDIVLTAMVGFSGLQPTIAAVSKGIDIALANKETLVVAGSLITSIAAETGSHIIPVDSEHSAIFQCLAGEDASSVEKIILTASGGPFRGKSIAELRNVTCKEALNHPNWCMGNKITIDSASLMNKGLEVIEAKWLFNTDASDIEVVIHPQSIIHSMVQFRDGAVKAQMSLPDMRLPIQYALAWPQRLPSDFPRFSFSACSSLTFETPDTAIFRNLRLAYQALNEGGNMPCILNAANEIAVDAFLSDRVGFLQMPEIIEQTMQKVSFIANPLLNDLEETNNEARAVAASLIRNH